MVGAASLGHSAVTESTCRSSTLSCSLVWLPYMEFAIVEGLLAPGNREDEKDKAKSKEAGENNGRSKETLKRGHGIFSVNFSPYMLRIYIALGGVIQDRDCISTRFSTDCFSP